MRTFLHHLLVGLGLFTFWVVLSGKLDPLHLTEGALAALAVTLLSGRLLYTKVEALRPEDQQRWLSFLPWWRIALYLLWLFKEVVKSNLAMIPIILGSPDRLKPQVVRFRPTLTQEVARITLANSITLTPGTVTLDIEPDGTFVVHAIDASSAQGLPAIARKVAWCFGESTA